MAYDPKTGKGLGQFYDANHRAFRAREWRGFRDTFYDFFPLALSLRLYGCKAGLPPHPHGKSHAALPLDGILSHRRPHGGPAYHGTAGQGGKATPTTSSSRFCTTRFSAFVTLSSGREPAPPQQSGPRSCGRIPVMFDEMTPPI